MRYWIRRPGIALGTLLVLALGLGAAGTVFAALWSVVLRPLPYPEPEQLVTVHNTFPELHLTRLGVSPLDYGQLSQHRELFSGIGTLIFLDLNRTGVERPEKINAVGITQSLFDTLQVKPILGRLFLPEETAWEGSRAVVISEEYWTSALGGDAGVLKQHLELNGEAYQIIGVMPGSFSFPNEVTQMWVPLRFRPAELTTASSNYFLRTFARVRSGLTPEQASQRLERFSAQMAAEAKTGEPRARAGWKMFSLPMQAYSDSKRQWTWVLFWSVLFLWGIVCWNFASLLEAVTGLVACALPAWRASRVQPSEALRR